MCGGCKAAHYCSKSCQTKDWKEHKVICKDMQLQKILSRVAEIFQKAYLDFRENTWDTPIVKIQERPDEIFIYDGDQSKNTKLFIDFPHHLIQNEQVRLAVLTAWMCNEPLGFLHDLIEKLLKGQKSSENCVH